MQSMPLSEARPFLPVRIAVLTVSDSRTPETDTSGQTLSDRISAAGHVLAGREIVKDDIEAIRPRPGGWLTREDLDVVIRRGGTGARRRDVTAHAMRPL